MNSTRAPRSAGGRPAGRRGHRLLLSCAMAGLVTGLLASPAARAADACGVAGNAATCARAAAIEADHPRVAAPVQDLTVHDGSARDGISGGAAPTAAPGRDVTVVSNGTVTTTGDYAFGVAALARPGGDASATANTVTTSGYRAHAVYAQGDAASATVNGALTTSGVLAAGVIAEAVAGRATVTNNGSISTTGSSGIGIFAYASDGVTISGTGSIETSGAGAGGISVNGYAGDTSVVAASVSTKGDYSRGVTISGSGDIAVDLGEVSTSGRISSAIDVATFQNGTGPLDADLIVRVDKVTVDGDYSQGIIAFTSNDGVLDIDAGTIGVHGADGTGILAESFTGDVTINADTVVTTGRGDLYNGPIGISVVSQSGNVSVGSIDRISTEGLNGTGVFVTTGGNVTIDLHDVATRGDDAAAVAATGKTVEVTIGGALSTAGADAIGISARGERGATVTNAGTVLTTGARARGIDADGGAGAVVISGAGGVTTRGESATAIQARAQGAVAVTAGPVRTTGAGAIGIDAASTKGNVVLEVASVHVSGAETIAVVADGAAGTSVTAAGNIVSDDGVGVQMRAGGNGQPAANARLSIASGGAVAGATDAVAIDATGGSTVTNAGTIIGGTGYALRVGGGAATLSNSGEIRGRLRLTDGADTLFNTGILTLSGTSDFGGGADSLTNVGTIRLAGTGAPQAVSIGGLEVLNSSGTIDLRNGMAGDRLAFTGTALAGTGAASLGLDVAFAGGAATADRIVLGSAAGSTLVSLAVSGTPTLIAPTTIIEATAASRADAFTVAVGQGDNGLVAFGVTYDAAQNVYQLVSTPGAAVHRQVQLGEALTSLWNRSADAVSAHFTSGRDATDAVGDGGDGRFWGQTLGEVNARKGRRGFGVAGVPRNGVDLGYRQDAFGLQLGVDLVQAAPEGGMTLGLSGGYLNSTTGFSAGAGDRITVDAGNVGVYAGIRTGPFFVNGLAKYDIYKVKRRGYVADLNGDDDAQAWGGRVEAGLRLGSAAFFAEPRASLAYSSTSLDDLSVSAGTLDYDRFTGLRGKAGLRVGHQGQIGASTVAFYLDGAAVKEFEGRDGLRFTSGGRSVHLRGDRLGTYGQSTLGMTATMAGRVSGFLEGHGEFGGAYRGGGGRAGLRIGF